MDWRTALPVLRRRYVSRRHLTPEQRQQMQQTLPNRAYEQGLADGTKQERERCATIAQHWTHPDTLRLHAGEMTAQELRTVVAVLNGVIAAIRAEPQ